MNRARSSDPGPGSGRRGSAETKPAASAPSGLDVLRRSLWPFSPLYGFVASLRNRLYDGGVLGSTQLDVPVVSVGNLTVGGTGKTPLVAWIVGRALDRGVRVGVLARGYGRARDAALNDEGMLLAARFQDLLQVQDPDRIAGGRALTARGAEWIVLDDGFQHRRLARDLDVVCVDARRPFGRGGMLPSGDLREPARPGLRRAGAVVLTRADALAPDERRARVQQMRGLVREGVQVLTARHAPTGFRPLGDAGPVEAPGEWRGRRVVAAAAIARPASFASTLEGLGCEVVGTRWFVDHHRFEAAEVEGLLRLAARERSALVVTAKDAVKIAPLLRSGGGPVDVPGTLVLAALDVELEFLGEELRLPWPE